jgi:hypothetical protein
MTRTRPPAAPSNELESLRQGHDHAIAHVREPPRRAESILEGKHTSPIRPPLGLRKRETHVEEITLDGGRSRTQVGTSEEHKRHPLSFKGKRVVENTPIKLEPLPLNVDPAAQMSLSQLVVAYLLLDLKGLRASGG